MSIRNRSSQADFITDQLNYRQQQIQDKQLHNNIKLNVVNARTALSQAKIVASDYVLDGQFLQAFLDAAADLDTLGAQSATADLSGAKTTLTNMKTHTDKGLQLSTAPGLPAELHSLMVDFESLITDFGKLLDAAAAADDAAITSAETSVQADADKISKYNFNQIGAEIDTFYKPMVDTFNAEMAKATA